MINLYMFLFAILITDPANYAKFFGAEEAVIISHNRQLFETEDESSNSSVTYTLLKAKGIKVSFYRNYALGKNDYFIVNNRKYQFLKDVSKNNKQLLYNQELGVFNLSTCSSYLVETRKGRKYFIITGALEGAAGRMASLRLFFVVDYTDSNTPIVYSLQNWTTFEYTFFDFDLDGYLDFSLFNDLNSPRYIQIKNYSLNDFRRITINGSNVWYGEWKKEGLEIK